MSDFGARKMRLAVAAAVPAAIAAGILVPALATAPLAAVFPTAGPYSTNYCPKNMAVVVSHVDGSYDTKSSLQDAIDEASGTSGASAATPSTPGSGAGDTVIACPGTFQGPITIATVYNSDGTVAADRSNVTVRSFDGPHDTTIQGSGSNTPVVSIDANGVTFGGQVHGFNIVQKAPAADATPPVTDLTGIQLGVPGAQDTSNEDEICYASAPVVGTTPAPTGSGCDKPPQQGVAINDQVVDNTFQNFLPDSTQFAGTITAIQADNTINATIQQNLIQHIIGDHSSVDYLNGIVVGGFGEAAGSGFATGTSTNINTDVLDNALHDLAPGDNTCSGAPNPFNVRGITLNGYILDATVYANLVHEVANDNSKCKAVGISSDAFGSLENEQTGTLAPANINIDDNNIDGDGQHAPYTGVWLNPTPASQGNTNDSPQCHDNVPTNDDPDCTSDAPPSSYTVTDNELHHLGTAIDVESLLGSNSYMRDNNFDDDIVGVLNNATGAGGAQADGNLDATNNFWGCSSGPATGTPGTSPGPGGCAYLVSASGTTSWEPPLRDHADHAGADAGNHAGEH